MGKQISYAVSCIFNVSIVLLQILIINSKGHRISAEIPTAYFKGRKHTWKEARNSCKLIELFEKIQVSNNIHGEYGHYGWVDASVEYTPWVEDKECYHVKQEDIGKTTVVTSGNQLQNCLQFCQAYAYIGLQQASCVCLNVNETDIVRAGSICKQNATEKCKEDKFLYCANAKISPHGFIIYKKVKMTGTIAKQLGPGNCLRVSGFDGRSNYFTANECKNTFNALCTNELNQTYCIAVTIGKTNHKVSWVVRPCTEKLPALCDDTDITSSQEQTSTITATISTGSEKKENRTNEILLIALIITAVLALVVIITVIIFYKRRTSLISRHLPLVVPMNEVTYAQVIKPTKEKAPVHAGEPIRNNTADDTYDHTEHHRLSQIHILTESNYDTMQSVGNEELENDYDVTSGTDRPRQIVVDDAAEYSHVEGEVEYQEIKDVST